NTVKALVQGQLDTFMGFKFIRTERLITQPNAFSFDTSTGLYSSGGSSITDGKSMIAWAGDGLLLSVGMNPIARIQERPDKKFSWQIYNQMSIGAVRMEEEKVVEIICDQS